MGKFLGGFLDDGGEWAEDLLTGKRKISCADNSYLENNGIAPKVFKTIIGIFGNKYNG